MTRRSTRHPRVPRSNTRCPTVPKAPYSVLEEQELPCSAKEDHEAYYSALEEQELPYSVQEDNKASYSAEEEQKLPCSVQERQESPYNVQEGHTMPYSVQEGQELFCSVQEGQEMPYTVQEEHDMPQTVQEDNTTLMCITYEPHTRMLHTHMMQQKVSSSARQEPMAPSSTRAEVPGVEQLQDVAGEKLGNMVNKRKLIDKDESHMIETSLLAPSRPSHPPQTQAALPGSVT